MSGLVIGQLVLLSSVFTTVHTSFPNGITIEDGGYKSLLVAIHEDVQEDQSLLEKLQMDFANGSQYLFEATSSRVYWKEISILIPSTWSKKPAYLPATHESFVRANIRIDKPNGWLPHNPYVLMTGKCGSQGLYMHLTPEYIQNSTINEQYGNLGTGRVLVHEWGHLRWGLGDEYPNLDHFYPSTKTKRIEGVRCSLDIAVEPLGADHSECQFSMDEINANNLNDINGFCLSYDDLRSSKARASIMYKPNILKSVTEFCHNDATRPGFHNYEAPNAQNEQCNYRSTWEVILETEDFAGGQNPPINTHVNTVPTFKLIQRIATKIVILIEASERLNQGDYFMRVRQAVSYFVEQIVETDIHLGVVTFGRNVNVAVSIAPLSSKEVRQNVSRSLPTVGSGTSDLAAGLNRALQQLSLTSVARGASIIVISGGRSEPASDLSVITGNLISSGVTVDAVLYGSRMDVIDTDLLDLVDTLQGVWYGFSGLRESSVLEDSLIAIIMERADIHKDIPKQLMSRSHKLSKLWPSIEEYVFVGSYLGKDLTFTVFFSSEDDLVNSQVYLNDPDGKEISVRDLDKYSANYELATVTIKLPTTASIGQWTYHIIYEGVKTSILVRVNVLSQVKSQLFDQIVVNGQLLQKEIDYNDVQNQMLSITVSEEYIFLIGTSVRVTIDRPNTPPDTLLMLDLDVELKGVYYNFTADGIYTVSVEVYSEGDALKFGLLEEYGESSDVVPSGISKRAKRDTEEEFTYLEPFTISQVIGSFRVKNFKDKSAVDVHPPSQFQIMEIKEDIGTYQQKQVTLQWLAPGDDYFYGQASSYDIRVSFDFRQLIDDFESAKQVTKDDIMSSPTDINKPQLGNSVEELVIKIPLEIEQDSIVAIAMVAVDAAGNRGPRSNILSVTFAKRTYWVIIIALIVVILIVIALVAVVCYFRNHRTKRSNSPVRYQVAKFSPEAEAV